MLMDTIAKLLLIILVLSIPVVYMYNDIRSNNMTAAGNKEDWKYECVDGIARIKSGSRYSIVYDVNNRMVGCK